MNASFTCPRTCPHFENRTADGHFDCRFRAVIDTIGSTRTTSHTVKVKVEYRDPRTLERACKTLGWKWLGYGKHTLSENSVTGHGFMPETFLLPAVLDSEGELHFDTYEGSWGDQTKLELLKSEYALATAEQAAEELGWQTERTAEGLTVHHPAGGILTMSKEGICETTGFIGSGCHAARESLKLAADGAVQNKPEYGQVAAQVQAGS